MRLTQPVFIGIRGTLVKKFEDAGDRYIGVIKVKDVGTQCVRVHFDWSEGDEEPQEHILDIGSGAEVEVAGWAERKGSFRVSWVWHMLLI